MSTASGTETVVPPASGTGDGSADLDGPPPQTADDARPWSWHLTRVTGLVLAVGLPVHFLRTFVLTDITRVSARSVAVRWNDPAARVLDWAILVLALVHGAAALAPRLAGADGDARRGRVAALGVWAVTSALVVGVTVVLISYRFT